MTEPTLLTTFSICMKKKISAAAIHALEEALTYAYWYKRDLKAFLSRCLTKKHTLTMLNWDGYKRNIVAELVELLVRNEDKCQENLIQLMAEVVEIRDFSHLLRLEDGKEKAKKAEDSVAALRELLTPHLDTEKEKTKIEERRKVAYKKRLNMQGVRDRLSDLMSQFRAFVSGDNAQQRGYRLETLMKELFDLFDLDPKASFRVSGEQIDGAFTFDNTDYLFEAKWHDKPVGTESLDPFAAKVARKLENTLGLLLSINGFSETAVEQHAKGRRLLILMDGSDLMAVLEERIDFIQLLLRKRRHAAQTGEIYLKITEIMGGRS